jgi:uncharacterized protein (DUF1501 family)
MSLFNRRTFLKAAGTGAAFGLSPLATLAQASGSAQPFSDYRALVCIYLFGGNDSFNMVIPSSTAEYNAYAASRQNMAVPRDDLLPVSPLNSDGVQYGLHPSMPELQNLFADGHSAVVTNVGPLLRPVTKEAYSNESVDIPPQLFSHNSQSDQWQSLQGFNASSTGWAGRISDLFADATTDQLLPTNVSLNGNQLLQSAYRSASYVIGHKGPAKFFGMDPAYNTYQTAVRHSYKSLLASRQSSVYERAFADVHQRSIKTYDMVVAAMANAQQVSVTFSGSSLSVQLQTVARLISARDKLQMKRQIFFVGIGGFDTHDDQNENQPGLFADLSRSISDFNAAMQELGVTENVTTFTESDFGRTLTSNGDGTDHGWGGIQLVTGGAVQGRRLYGDYPELSMGGPDEVSGGRLIPKLSADQYVATLSKWFGVADENLSQVAPNIGNFDEKNLGFLS